jgi:opacity protein-like surface antigen
MLTPDSMLYGRVGFAVSELTLEDNGGFGALNVLLLPLNISEEKDRAALRLGAGLEQRICPRLSLRLDYIYTYYGKQDVNATGVFVDAGDSITLSTQTSVKVYNNTAMLGLSYAL